MVKLANRQGGA